MAGDAPQIVNMHTAPEKAADVPAAWENFRRDLTPLMRSVAPSRFGMGRLGMEAVRVRPGHSACPAHTHLQADELFVVMSGSGLFRSVGTIISPTGAVITDPATESIRRVGPGDVIACPADTGKAHHLANPTDSTEDLVYLAIGSEPPADVCTYPDNGQVCIDGLEGFRGVVQKQEYYVGQPVPTPALRQQVSETGEQPC